MNTGRVKPTGLMRLLNAFGNTWRGLTGAWREEAAFRQECALAAVLVPAALWLADGPIEFALLVGPVIVVLIVELLNSAVEAAIDRIGEERHALSGLAKDLGSAAVFGSFVLLALNWAAVLLA
jgi:diacylglycerol kinase (ATP)